MGLPSMSTSFIVFMIKVSLEESMLAISLFACLSVSMGDVQGRTMDVNASCNLRRNNWYSPRMAVSITSSPEGIGIPFIIMYSCVGKGKEKVVKRGRGEEAEDQVRSYLVHDIRTSTC